MVATLSAEKKAKEASSDAERRDAKEARKVMAESQREVSSLRQEAAKVTLDEVTDWIPQVLLVQGFSPE